jgi:hypothetical protein
MNKNRVFDDVVLEFIDGIYYYDNSLFNNNIA